MTPLEMLQAHRDTLDHLLDGCREDIDGAKEALTGFQEYRSRLEAEIELLDIAIGKLSA